MRHIARSRFCTVLVVTGSLSACNAETPLTDEVSEVRSALEANAQAAAAPSTGRWIWTSNSQPNQWVAFRKTFTLTAAPSSAITQIAADTKYWLYVNGNLVTFEGGLKRGPNPNDTYYDEKDIASYLTSGSNTIAILVWYFGKGGFSHNDSGAGGLLFQSDVVVGSNSIRLNSDNTWKAITHPGYSNDTTGTQPNFRLAESNIYYDARNASSMNNWYKPGFVATSWPAASDKGSVQSPPWNALVKRPIPFFKYSSLLNYTNAAPSTGQGTTPIVMKLPSNIQVTPYLQVNAPAGAVIDIQTDHYLDGGDVGVRSTYVTVQGTQDFESLGWMSGTSVQYTIPSSVQILALKYRESGYATSVVGSFTSDDTFYNTLWKKAATTVYLNMRDNYSDCPTRERAQWWGDAVNEQKEGYYIFDLNAAALGQKAIAELVSWQKAGGEFCAPVPSSINFLCRELPVQMLASVYSFWTSYLYTGNAGALNTYARVKKYMNLWSLDSDGLVVHREGDWGWEDGGDDLGIDKPLLDNAWYYMALDTTIKLANLTGNSADVGVWQQRSNSISSNYNRVFWNATNGEYRSPGFAPERDTDDRGNALAVVAGLSTPSQRSALSEVLLNHVNASPYMELYVLEALYLLGSPTVAESRMKSRYTDQVNDPGYTLWEYWKREDGTDDHGWNGGPLYVLSSYAAGIRPTSPGYATYQIRPQMGAQKSINAVVPTIKGNISLNLNLQSSTHFVMSLTSPQGTTATIGVSRLGMTSPTISANGKTVYKNDTFVASVTGISYAGRDLDYVYFNATPGSWKFDETGGTPTYCAAEGGTCTFNGTMLVRYGANSSFAYRIANNSISCTNEAFGGDPIYGVTKQCNCSSSLPLGGLPGYTLCSDEGGSCSFTGRANVIFGAYGSFTNGTYNGSVACNVATFGDPIYGVHKKCYFAAEPTGNGWTQCAVETGVCAFPGAKMVAYGANGAYLYQVGADRVSCNGATFGGDPIYGTPKNCYYR